MKTALKLISVLFFAALLLTLTNCKKDEPVKLPTLSTLSVTNITHTTAQSGGNITCGGGGLLTARGIAFGASPNPTIDDNIVSDGSGSAGTRGVGFGTSPNTNGSGNNVMEIFDIGLFDANIVGVNPGTTYYIRAYATNSAGTAYGNQVEFTSLSVELPTLITSPASNITQTSAIVGGNITSDGGGKVYIKGIYYSIDPHFSYSSFKYIGGSSTGLFTLSIIGLNPGTTYYVKAFTSNSAGTVFGNTVDFTTPGTR